MGAHPAAVPANAAPATAVPVAASAWLQQASAAAIARRARMENFPVARLFPVALRADIAALYGVARLIDEAGDSAPGDRLAALAALDADVDRLAAGNPDLPILAALLPACARGLDPTPLHDLVAANRQDQSVTRYGTFAELRDYCRLSADPVGRMVLDLLGLATPDRLRRSDEICTALQLAEHLQDVGEDLRAGRIYLPQDALARHDVSADLLADLAHARDIPAAGRARVAALLCGETTRARALLDAGSPLIGTIPGRARLAIAGFVAGGAAALDAVRAAGPAAVTATPRPRPHRLALHLAVGLARGGLR